MEDTVVMEKDTDEFFDMLKFIGKFSLASIVGGVIVSSVVFYCL